MSRLIDKLNKASKSAPQPMGFLGAKAAPSAPRMLVVACLSPEDTEGLPGSASGADAVIIDFTKAAPNGKGLKKLAAALPDLPWGAWLNDVTEDVPASLVKAGADFIVFPAESRYAAVYREERKTGRLLAAAPDMDTDFLRIVSDLPLDAVFVTGNNDMIPTWRWLMACQRFTHLANKPVLVKVPAAISPEALKPVWEAGVDGIVMDAGAGQTEGSLQEIRTALEKPGFLPPRKHGKTEALLPHLGMETAHPVEKEEDEEEEE